MSLFLPRRLIASMALLALSRAHAGPPRTDILGEALPPGATARIGTNRLQHFLLSALAYSPDGKVLASADMNGSLRLWGPSGRLRRFRGHTSSVQSVAFSHDSAKLASGGDDRSAILWDVRRGVSLHTLKHLGAVLAVAFSDDGRTIASGCADGKVRLWDAGSRCQSRDRGDDQMCFGEADRRALRKGGT